MKKSFLLLLLLLSVTVFAGGDDKDKNPYKGGFNLNNLDKSVKPQDDFFQYAAGGWIKNNPIGDEYSRWGTFEMLQERNNSILRQILDDAVANKTAAKGSAAQKIGDFYAAGMDTVAIEAAGYTPLIPDLQKVDALKTKQDIIRFVAQGHLSGISSFFGFFASSDSKNSSMNAATLNQGGVSLPDVEYYTKDDNRSKDIRARYIKFVTNMFRLVNTDSVTAANYAGTILKIETEFAKVSNTRVEDRDADKTYNKYSYAEIKNIFGDFDFDTYIKELQVTSFEYVIVGQPKFFKRIGSLLSEVSVEDWKVYLKWRVIRDGANTLSSAFVNEAFDFSGKFLQGTKAMQPRWKRVLASVNGTLGQLLGQLYVAQVFPPEAKARAMKIVNALQVAMGNSIKNLEWMSPATKEAALKKLSTFAVNIGYPDKWRDYSELTVERDSYYANMKRAARWSRRVNLNKIGKPVDKSEWFMNPQTVNASYSPDRNDITFPAAILQPPFFNQDADDAINYGAMGAVIGHEITHGFDDEGRKYDSKGNLTDWWTKEDNDKFTERSDRLVAQFDNFTAIDTFRVNGRLTLGENIADLGGLTISYAAFSNTDQYKSGKEIDGFTPSQRFFLGWAQVWAEIFRPEALKLRLKTDVHSPGKFRVNGPLMNMPEFFNAFGIKPGDKMRAGENTIVKIW